MGLLHPDTRETATLLLPGARRLEAGENGVLVIAVRGDLPEASLHLMNFIVEDLVRGLPSYPDILRVAIRLLAAAVFGGVIGFERERAGKAAGLRTHMLVSLGAAIFVIAAAQVNFDTDDLSRIIQGLVTGIGFIGGGAILKSKDRGNIEGLTTAAGIWLTAGIGVACGLGVLGVALISVILAWLILTGLVALERRTPHYHGTGHEGGKP